MIEINIVLGNGHPLREFIHNAVHIPDKVINEVSQAINQIYQGSAGLNESYAQFDGAISKLVGSLGQLVGKLPKLTGQLINLWKSMGSLIPESISIRTALRKFSSDIEKLWMVPSV